MIINIKTNEEIEAMKEAGAIAATALQLAGQAIRPGVTTAELDSIIRRYIVKHDAKPSFLGYGGFPASACISVDQELIHGIPSSSRKLEEGSIVSIDVGAYFRGWHGDCANTFPVGTVSPEAQRLIEVTRQSFFEGIQFAKKGFRLGDIGSAIQRYVESNGYSIVRKYVGHGVGRALHEEPNVPNYGTAGRGVRLEPGMTIAIEPMVNEGVDDVYTLQDKWTVVTRDGKLSAHYENTIAITGGEPIILTKAYSEVSEQ